MGYEPHLFLLVVAVVAAVPAAAVARLPGLRVHPAWKKWLVFAGAFVGLLPLAVVPALILMFYMFGIDMLD